MLYLQMLQSNIPNSQMHMKSCSQFDYLPYTHIHTHKTQSQIGKKCAIIQIELKKTLWTRLFPIYKWHTVLLPIILQETSKLATLVFLPTVQCSMQQYHTLSYPQTKLIQHEQSTESQRRGAFFKYSVPALFCGFFCFSVFCLKCYVSRVSIIRSV